MSIKERYWQLIDHYARGNKRAFASLMSISPSVIENIVGSRATNPSFDVIQKTLISFENINAEWLIVGKGEMFKNGNIPEDRKRDIVYNKEKSNDRVVLEMIRDLSMEIALLRKENEDLKKGKECKYGNLTAES